MMKRTACIALSLITLFSLVACKGNGSNSDANGKTVLTVGTWDGGLGTEWLQTAAKEFEEKYKGQSFSEGKRGVYIDIRGAKDYGGDMLLDASLNKDLYFTENVNYFDFVNRNKLADITEVVQGDLAVFGETGKTIEGKIAEAYQNFLTAKDGKYYAIPFYDGFYGIVYDVDLFEKYGWYFDSDGDIIGRNGDLSAKSLGVDKVQNTADDGLPATYEQFEELMETIRNEKASMVPFAYSGAASEYVMRTMINYWADYEGKDKMMLNYTFDGEAEIIDEMSSDGTYTTKTETITVDNGYLLQKQAGKYQALTFLNDCLLGNSGNYTKNGSSHLETQADFVIGSTEKSDSLKTYAMLIEGVWWENEAKASFDLCETTYGSSYSKTERRFAMMPIPKVNGNKIGEKATLVSQGNSYCFVNKNCSNMEVAKLFIQFLHTDAQMSMFTKTLSITRALNYEVSETDMQGMTYYGKSVVEMKKNSDVVYPFSALQKVIDNSIVFNNESWAWKTKVNGKTYENPLTAFFDKTATPVSYFNGLSANMTQSDWMGLK